MLPPATCLYVCTPPCKRKTGREWHTSWRGKSLPNGGLWREADGRMITWLFSRTAYNYDYLLIYTNGRPTTPWTFCYGALNLLHMGAVLCYNNLNNAEGIAPARCINKCVYAVTLFLAYRCCTHVKYQSMEIRRLYDHD